MTETQIKWLLDTFFLPSKCPGAENIARKLIETGECLATEQVRDIWIDGVGNFIEKKKSEEGVGLIKLTFDANEFCSLDNEYFCSYYLKDKEQREKEAVEKIMELKEIAQITCY